MAKQQTQQPAENDFGLDLLDPTEPGATKTNAVIYGQPGAGKSFLGATAPKPLIIDLEQGAAASAKAAGNPDARVFRANTMDDVRKAYKALAKGGHGFETVILDPVSELQRMIMKDVLDRYPNSKRPYDDQPMISDYQKAMGDAIKLITAFRALPDVRTVIMAHADIPDHEDDMVKPLLSGKTFKTFLPGAMDLLGYLYVESDGEEATRKLQTVSSATVIAKNRGGKLPAIVINPNLTEIFRLMEE